MKFILIYNNIIPTGLTHNSLRFVLKLAIKYFKNT